MPKVGKKEFAYTGAGKKAAKAYAKKTGQNVEKYYGGGSVDPFSSKNPRGVMAEKEMEKIEEQNAIPTVNAMDRSQASPMGEEVGTGVYKEGGKVDTSKEALEKYWKHSVGRATEGALKGKTKHTPKRAGSKSKDKPYTVLDVVKKVEHKENIKKGFKEYWDKENKGKK